MKKISLKLIVAIFAILSFSYALYAQEENNRSPKFTYEAGFGKSILAGFQNMSPWGVHYRGNYNSGYGINAQFNYIFKDRSLLGLKFDGFGVAGNYKIEDNQLVTENINTYYLAPQLGWWRSISPRVSFLSNIGVGYALYQSSGLLDNTEYSIYSHMLGFNVDISLDYLITKQTSIGCKTSVFGAFSDKQYREIGGEKSEFKMDKWNKINPSKIDFSIFYRIYF